LQTKQGDLLIGVAADCRYIKQLAQIKEELSCLVPMRLSPLWHLDRSQYVTTRNVCFVEGQITSTRQRNSMPRPALGALGKDRPSTKISPRQRKSLPRVTALDKDTLGKFSPLGHGGRGPSDFAEGQPLDPRQRYFLKFLPRALAETLGKGFF